MHAYDFDGTIYDGDSTVDFYLYSLCKHPELVRFVPFQLSAVLLHTIGRLDTTTMKERFFCFFKGLKTVDELAEAFWESRQSKIMIWYLERMEETDLIISASPEFLLEPICRRLGIRPPIATIVSWENGQIQGKNCKGAEKVHRFLEKFPNESIRQFYSDSLTDAPLADFANQAFLVKRGTIYCWPRR